MRTTSTICMSLNVIKTETCLSTGSMDHNRTPTFPANHTSKNEPIPVLEVSIVLGILIVLSVLGNLLVCCAFIIQPRLRRVLYYPVLNLAIADILCGLVAMTSYLAKKHVSGGVKERVVCDISRFSYFVTEYASVLNLTVISIERTFCIFRPLTHLLTVTSRRMKAVMLLVWCDAIVVASLPFFWQKASSSSNCTFKPTKAWSIIVISSNVMLPFLIIFVCQLSIYAIAIKHTLTIRQQNRVSSRRGADELPRCKRSARINAWVAQRKATITLSIVVGLFFICWAPSSFYYFLQRVNPQRFKGTFGNHEGLFNAVVKMLTFANSCFNPFVYAWMNKDFKNAFLRVLSRRLYRSSVERQARIHTEESTMEKRPLAKNDVRKERNLNGSSDKSV